MPFTLMTQFIDAVASVKRRAGVRPSVCPADVYRRRSVQQQRPASYIVIRGTRIDMDLNTIPSCWCNLPGHV